MLFWILSMVKSSMPVLIVSIIAVLALTELHELIWRRYGISILWFILIMPLLVIWFLCSSIMSSHADAINDKEFVNIVIELAKK